MKQRIKAAIKAYRIFYLIYYYLGSLFFKILGIFVSTDKNSILFVSYGGKRYDDSPKNIYEYLKNSKKYSKYKLIWAFEDPSAFKNIENKVKIDSLKYFITALKSHIWITNSSVSRGLNFQKKSTINLIFSHGITAIKKGGIDINQKSKTYRLNFVENFTKIFIEGKKELDTVSNAWRQKKSKFVNLGLPRNDDLADLSDVDEIKKKLKIDRRKKVILYAPTFRELSRDKNNNNVLKIPINFYKWTRKLNKDYTLIITCHYEIASIENRIPNNSFIVNATDYPNINDLLKISDILISDYSNLIFEYSILERPIFCYGYDYDTFKDTRGFYTELENLYSHGVIKNETELLNSITSIDYDKECKYTKKYIKEKFVKISDGHATERCVDYIFNKLIKCSDAE